MSFLETQKKTKLLTLAIKGIFPSTPYLASSLPNHWLTSPHTDVLNVTNERIESFNLKKPREEKKMEVPWARLE